MAVRLAHTARRANPSTGMPGPNSALRALLLALCLGAFTVVAAVYTTPPFFGLDAASNLLILAPERTITLDAAAVVLPGGVDLLHKMAEQDDALSSLRATVALLNATLQAMGAANTALLDRLAQLEARVTGLSAALAAQQHNMGMLVNATVISLLSSPASVEAFRGPTGPMGSPGAQGPTGSASTQGAPGPQGGVGSTGPQWSLPTSCADVLARNSSATSGLYFLYLSNVDVNGSLVTSWSTWCEMRNGTAWTLLLKVDGTKSTFAYASSLWTSTATLNEPMAANLGQPASLNTEYKSVMFSYMPFSRLLLGMRDTTESYNQTRWAIMSGPVRTSLRDVLAVNATSVYSASRADFLNMAGPSAQLQPLCTMSEINLAPQPGGSDYNPNTASVRIGIIANEQNGCSSPDTFVGFGGKNPNQSINLACGNYPYHTSYYQWQIQLPYPKFGYVLAA